MNLACSPRRRLEPEPWLFGVMEKLRKWRRGEAEEWRKNSCWDGAMTAALYTLSDYWQDWRIRLLPNLHFHLWFLKLKYCQYSWVHIHTHCATNAVSDVFIWWNLGAYHLRILKFKLPVLFKDLFMQVILVWNANSVFCRIAYVQKVASLTKIISLMSYYFVWHQTRPECSPTRFLPNMFALKRILSVISWECMAEFS